MTLYREHSGGLMESLDTVITVGSLDDLRRYYARDTRINGWDITSIVAAFLGNTTVVLGTRTNY